ncbi:MAG: helix-turn-helix domain-containing protein [Alloprevotella sp.]
MNPSLYHDSLFLALPLMLFFGFHMLLARVPDKTIYGNYLLSRRMMGCALLLLAANYSVHLFCAVRLWDIHATILMNMVTYFLCYWLFSAAMMTLLSPNYITRRRFTIHISLWLAFTALAASVFLFPTLRARNIATVLLAVWLVAYGIFLSVRLLCTYHKAVRMFEETHSDDIEAYIRWLSFFTYWAIGFGVGCGLLTFLPNEYIFIWILSSIPFYIYLYCRYQNYVLFYEKVQTALLEEMEMAENDVQTREKIEEDTPNYHDELELRISEWTKNGGYCESGVTLNDLCALFCTNRTYLSEHIHRVFGMTFRDWIMSLRIDHAKQLMLQQPDMKIKDISDQSGFLSLSHFSRTFREKEGCTPNRWRKNNLIIFEHESNESCE